MKTLGIIQPGRIGDLIICMPIADYYNDQGYKIIWPIREEYMSHFKNISDHINYIPITNNFSKCVEQARKEVNKCDKIIDICFGFSGTKILSNAWRKSGQIQEEFKYNIAQVPFDLKWTLRINRDLKREKKLYEHVVGDNKDFIIYHFKASNYACEYYPPEAKCYTNIIIEKQTDNIFDWITCFEKAQILVLVSSCFANLVEQYINADKKYLIKRPNVKLLLRKEWDIV